MSGMSGTNGIPGIPGVPGSPGRDGIKGAKGNMGTKGETGKTGATGRKGEACYDDPTQRVNWKQCVWKAQSDIDSGNIKMGRIEFKPRGDKYHVSTIVVNHAVLFKIYSSTLCLITIHAYQIVYF